MPASCCSSIAHATCDSTDIGRYLHSLRRQVFLAISSNSVFHGPLLKAFEYFFACASTSCRVITTNCLPPPLSTAPAQ